MTRIIGLDPGSRRIGVALGDTDLGMAFVRPAIRVRRGGRTMALDEIARLVADEAAELVVIGLPLHADGSEGVQASAARRFGEDLAERGIAVAFEDERLTSWAAGEALANSGRSPGRRSGELDSTAARLILQQYLDARRLPGVPEESE